MRAKTRREVWSVRSLSILTFLMGIVNIISAVTPRMHRLEALARISPLEVRHGGRLTVALGGFALILLANSLWRRKRVAWYGALVVLVVSAASHILKGFDLFEATLSLILAGWLLILRPHFHARSDPPSIRQGLLTLATALAFTLAYGIAGFFLMDRQFRVSFGLLAAARQTIIMFTQFYDPGLEPITRLGRYFADSIYIVGLSTLSYAAVMLVRPVLVRHPSTPDERERAARIVERFGCSSLARLALLPDKSYFFSSGGSLIAYAISGRVALALGDPIGPDEDRQLAINEYLDYCAGNDWMAAFYQTQPEFLENYESSGMRALMIGQAAIVMLVGFTLSGRANKGLRSAVNRLQRLGYITELVEPPLDPGLLSELRQISDEWLARMRTTEMRFSVGWFMDEYIRDSRVMLVREPDGAIVAFANILPEYQKNELSLDLMRHRTEEHGVMDLLFASMLEWARGCHYDSFDLGLSALSGLGETAQDPVIERSLHYIYEHENQFYNFKGLHEYKDKFNPYWSPRYLVYPGLGALPAVTVALIRADAGSNLSGVLHKR